MSAAMRVMVMMTSNAPSISNVHFFTSAEMGTRAPGVSFLLSGGAGGGFSTDGLLAMFVLLFLVFRASDRLPPERADHLRESGNSKRLVINVDVLSSNCGNQGSREVGTDSVVVNHFLRKPNHILRLDPEALGGFPLLLSPLPPFLLFRVNPHVPPAGPFL